jgi:hypothetical protein
MATTQKAVNLLYFTLIDKQVKGRMVEYKLRHLNDSAIAHGTHLWSSDKDAVTNCYRDLQIGRSYVVLEWRTGKVIPHKDGSSHNQIVYAYCVDLDPTDITKVIKFGKTNTPKDTYQYAMDINTPMPVIFDEEFQ